MKITLISTSTYPSDQGVRTISSVLKKRGHSVRIIFMTLGEDYSVNYTKKELTQLENFCKDSDLIGINSFASSVERAEKIIQFLKENLETPIVYGGIHATLFPEKCIKLVDIVCVGEGEGAILDIISALERGESIKKIKNVWSKGKNGNIIKNPVRPTIDNLDELPLPDYDLEDHFILENHIIRKFEEEDLGGQIFFLTGRGCPYGCDYCSNSCFNKIYEGKRKKILRWHTPEYIINGILYFKNKFPTLGYFDIRDDTFSLRPFRDIQKFCNLYREKINMRFKCLADPHTISDEKIKLLVDAGCTNMIVGIQGSEKTNKEIYHRNQTNIDVLKASKILNKYKDKLAVIYDVIASNPYEKPEYIIELIRLLQKIPKPYFLSVNNLVFFPGSVLYERAKKDGMVKSEEDAAYKLDYWDRAGHIKLKNMDIYLNLILNLMRGGATKRRMGCFPHPILNYLLEPKRVKKNLKNPKPSKIVLNIVDFNDRLRAKTLKPLFRKLPLNFKLWYDKIRHNFS